MTKVKHELVDKAKALVAALITDRSEWKRRAEKAESNEKSLWDAAARREKLIQSQYDRGQALVKELNACQRALARTNSRMQEFDRIRLGLTGTLTEIHESLEKHSISTASGMCWAIRKLAEEHEDRGKEEESKLKPVRYAASCWLQEREKFDRDGDPHDGMFQAEQALVAALKKWMKE